MNHWVVPLLCISTSPVHFLFICWFYKNRRTFFQPKLKNFQPGSNLLTSYITIGWLWYEKSQMNMDLVTSLAALKMITLMGLDEALVTLPTIGRKNSQTQIMHM
jgi:hypothetical protein